MRARRRGDVPGAYRGGVVTLPEKKRRLVALLLEIKRLDRDEYERLMAEARRHAKGRN